MGIAGLRILRFNPVIDPKERMLASVILGTIGCDSVDVGVDEEPGSYHSAAMLSTVTATTDAEDIESLVSSASAKFKSAPARGKRLVPEVGTYVKLSGTVMATREQGGTVELVQENYYMGANGRVYTFAFVAPVDDAAVGRAEFETFLSSIWFE